MSNITWFKNGIDLDFSDVSVTISTRVEEEFMTFSELTVTNMTFADTGSYFCMAVNNLVSVQSTNSTSAEIIVNSELLYKD